VVELQVVSVVVTGSFMVELQVVSVVVLRVVYVVVLQVVLWLSYR
jgi:hypothetical protein